ncbi:hypothetical protein K438DRAFT_1756670 [Mycena galopus ATCC 62051]|nr:hypothetical protein K438DRAFT_1756670 [Mycena galopus ATCC 62051]
MNVHERKCGRVASQLEEDEGQTGSLRGLRSMSSLVPECLDRPGGCVRRIAAWAALDVMSPRAESVARWDCGRRRVGGCSVDERWARSSVLSERWHERERERWDEDGAKPSAIMARGRPQRAAPRAHRQHQAPVRGRGKKEGDALKSSSYAHLRHIAAGGARSPRRVVASFALARLLDAHAGNSTAPGDDVPSENAMVHTCGVCSQRRARETTARRRQSTGPSASEALRAPGSAGRFRIRKLIVMPEFQSPARRNKGEVKRRERRWRKNKKKSKKASKLLRCGSLDVVEGRKRRQAPRALGVALSPCRSELVAVRWPELLGSTTRHGEHVPRADATRQALSPSSRHVLEGQTTRTRPAVHLAHLSGALVGGVAYVLHARWPRELDPARRWQYGVAAGRAGFQVMTINLERACNGINALPAYKHEESVWTVALELAPRPGCTRRDEGEDWSDSSAHQRHRAACVVYDLELLLVATGLEFFSSSKAAKI